MRGAARARVFLPLKLAQDLRVMQPSDVRDSMRGFNKQPSYSTISVRVKNPKQVEAVEQAIKKLGFNTFSILDATRSLRQFFAVLDLFLGIFGSLALAVASIGIVNTLVMAILERRLAPGCRKFRGRDRARRRNCRRLQVASRIENVLNPNFLMACSTASTCFRFFTRTLMVE